MVGPMERLWLIRTRHNKILGPVALKKISELLGKGSLGPYDEICSGNGYWIRIREEELVQKYIQQGQEQVFNPLNAAKLHPNLISFVDEVLAGKRPIREGTSTTIHTNTDISMVGKNLPKIDPATLENPAVNNSTTPTSATGVGTMPSDDDLAYPSMDDVAQIDASVDAAKVDAAAPVKPVHPSNPTAAPDTGGAKLPSADDLDFPDMGGGEGDGASAAAAAAPTPNSPEAAGITIGEDDQAQPESDDEVQEEDQRSLDELPVAAGTTTKSSDSQTGILTRAHFDLRKLQKAQAEEEQAEMEASAANDALPSHGPQFTSLPDMEDVDEEEEAVQQEFEKSSVIRVRSLEKKQRAQNFKSRLVLVIIIAMVVGVLFAVGPLMQRVAQYKQNLKPKAAVTETTENAATVNERPEAAHPENAAPQPPPAKKIEDQARDQEIERERERERERARERERVREEMRHPEPQDQDQEQDEREEPPAKEERGPERIIVSSPNERPATVKRVVGPNGEQIEVRE